MLGGVAVALLSAGLTAAPAAAFAPPATPAPPATHAPSATPAAVAMAGTGECTADTRITDSPPAFQSLQATRAWAVSKGAGIVVAVVDSGVDASNPHLRGAVLKGVDLVKDGAAADGRSDDYGHGTALAGQIAARRIDGSGLVGLAPSAKILPVRVYSNVDDRAVEAGTGPNLSLLVRGIRYAADHGAQVINVSMSTAEAHASLAEAVAYAARKGSVVVSSAGNRDNSTSIGSNDEDGPRYPAADTGAIGVAATGVEGTVTDDSIHGPHVMLSAPGQNILSAGAAGGDCIFAADQPYTSYAAPYVSAALALVASAHRDETPAQWVYRLEATARRADPDARDDVSGWGVVQPYSALTLVPGPGIRGPKSPFPGAVVAPAAEHASAAPVTVDDLPPMNAPAWAITSIVGVIALAALGSFGTLSVLRRRARTAQSHALTGRGLYGDDAPPAP
jgi:type VII secretion-associated serine protease mycosin